MPSGTPIDSCSKIWILERRVTDKLFLGITKYLIKNKQL